MALLCLAQAACAQTLNFDPPLRVTHSPGHSPVDIFCSYPSGAVTHTRYWQKTGSDDGTFPGDIQLGQALPPPCSKMVIPRPPVEVTCFFYPGFMVKQLYTQGDEGDAGLSIVPVPQGQARQACAGKPLPGEFVLAGTAQSGAGLWGVVSGYLFLTGGDDDAPVFGDITDIVRAAPPHADQIAAVTILNVPANRITRVPGGFDMHFMAGQTANCAVGSSDGAACLARLEQMTGAKIAMAQCMQEEPANNSGNPVWVQYPALLSVRGGHAMLRATGPAARCIPAE